MTIHDALIIPETEKLQGDQISYFLLNNKINIPFFDWLFKYYKLFELSSLLFQGEGFIFIFVIIMIIL